jgi:hypothetical protein
MKKINFVLGILILIIFASCNQDNSDVVAVKRSKSDLGAMYEKTVEEVVQDIAGLKGKANWSVFKPEGDFSEDTRVVEVNITKEDTTVYSSIKIQFIYNRSTGYVQQGSISVNEKKISILEWWSYYANILILNSGSTKKYSDNVANSKSENIPVEKDILEEETAKEDNVKFENESNYYEPIDPRSRPDRYTYYEYTSNEWFDMSKGFVFGADHPKNETTMIRETETRIIIDFSNGKTLLYEILKVEPYKYGVNYVVEIDGQRKKITKSPDPNGGISYSLEKEWIFDKILEGIEAGID